MGNMISRRYRYGASFVDSASGVRFEGHHPHERPDLWKLYLHEAEGRYRNFGGFEGKLHLQELDEGTGVSLFLLGFDDHGVPVAGVRCHGPLESSNQAFLLQEMGSSLEISLLKRTIDDGISGGILEIKGAWSKGEVATGHRLIAAISRSVTHCMNWLGAEHAIAAVSDTLLPAGLVTGARMVGESSVPFPDDRYRTIAVSWQRSRSHELSDDEHQRALRLEAEQLSRNPDLHKGLVSHDSTRTRSWRPLVLDVRVRDQREVLRVLRADPALQVIDRFAQQRTQLSEIKPAPSPSLEEEPQRWVYYPWRRAVVRLLGPRSFGTLRLDRNRNKLTRAEQAQQRRLRIGVVGLSAGHSIAHVLAMEGLAGELRVADFDTVELSNLNRIPGSVLDLGVNKAVVAARRISEIDPYLRILTIPEGITDENLGSFLDGLDLVIEECDSLDMKMRVREAARERRIPVLMETSDRGVLDVERFDLEPDRPIFHGLLPGLHSSDLVGLSIQQKAPYVLRMLGAADVTSRGAASLLEVGVTVTGWPQLGSEVTLGAATAAAAVRRIGLSGDLPSGRVRFDVEEILSGIAPLDVLSPLNGDDDDPGYDGEENFAPYGGSVEPLSEDADPVDIIVEAARWAPSGGNIQPWRFEADANQIRMYLVPERTTMMDVRYRGSYVAIGAALFNARVAAASLKTLGEYQLFPEGSPSHCVATLSLGESTDFEIASLAPRVRTRVANRQMGDASSIDAEVVKQLSLGVEREGARLRMAVARDRIEEMAGLLAESDRIRFLLPTLHREMVGELRFPGQDSLDEGLDVRTLELSPPEMAALELLRRPDVMEHLADWRAGQALGARTRALVGSSSALAVVTVPRADPAWYVRGGSAVERLWLTAEMHGLAVQPVSPVFLYAVDEKDLHGLGGERHIDSLFDLSQRFNEFWDLDDGEHVALLLRLSHAPSPSTRSARLPLSELLSREWEMA